MLLFLHDKEYSLKETWSKTMEKPYQETKYLYRKSNCTLNKHSKTCSGASQFLTRSGIIQLKKKLPKTHDDNGKNKRDLSMATDKCILRGIYKRKFGRFKCSVNTPDTGTINESKGDHNSCGDNIPQDNYKRTRLNIDVTTLVVENFKDLLNDWIKKYLLNNDETKQKIFDTVLDSILHKKELQQTSSSYTYTSDIKVDRRNRMNSNKTAAKKKVTYEKRSCQTVPVVGKYVKLISTLSIPRRIKRHVSTNSHHLKPAARKIRYKNVFLTISRSSTFLLNSSSFNLLSISTKSFIKRCAIYDSKEINTSKKHNVVLVPKFSCSESTPSTRPRANKVDASRESKVYPSALEIEPLESLVKSIYAGDPANITSTDKNISRSKQDNYTMTDTDCTLNNVTSLNHCQKLNWKKVNNSSEPEAPKVRKKRKKITRSKPLAQGIKIRKTKSMKKQMQSFKYLNKITADTNNLYKNYSEKENNFIKDLQGILTHFIHYTDNKNIKFDVKINIFPGVENKKQPDANNEKSKKNTLRQGNLTAAYNVISTQILPEDKTGNTVVGNESSTSISLQKSQPNIISILDGAISQSKYVISKEESQENTDKNITSHNAEFEPIDTLTGIEIAKDISELRVIIRDLAVTTEKFVKEHLANLKSTPRELEVKEKVIKVDNEINKDSLKTSTISKGVQHSGNKSQIMSGLKLKKEPKKKDLQVLNTRLGKKSISYNVIDSESILKVTDMTSVTAVTSTDMTVNKTMHYSLPKSKSLFEVTRADKQNNRKLLAYYCDEIVKSRQFVQQYCKCSAPNSFKYTTCSPKNNDDILLIDDNVSCGDKEIASEDQVPACNEEYCELSGPGFSSSSVYVDVEDRKKCGMRNRTRISFWEGLFYCILLWIPVVIIFWLIYVHVIRDFIQPVIHNGTVDSTTAHPKNKTLFYISLSDLGF